mgnify:FL=1
MIDCIIQARLGSTRYPRKILQKISNNKTVLEFLLDQLQNSERIDKIIIATTDLDEDDKIVNFCQEKNILFFRGDRLNVLKRYYECAKNFKSKNIVRVTSDCPLIDPNLIDYGIDKFYEGDYDYLTNSLEETYPHGLDYQILKFETLKTIFNNANLNSEKEHVIPYVINNKEKFKILNLKNKENFSKFRVTLDWPDDLILLKKIVNDVKSRPILMDDIVSTFKKNPEYQKINSTHPRHEGYTKSLLED